MTSWFLAATLTGAACALLALAVIAAGWSRRIPEVAMLGTGLLSISVLATAFGLSGTNVGVGPAEWAAVLALPIGILSVAPVLAPSSKLASTIGRAWRVWAVAISFGVTALAAVLLSSSSTVPTPAIVGLLAPGLVGAMILVRRQLLLFRVSRRPAALVTAIAVTLVATSAAANMTTSPGTTLAWLLLITENIGVFGAGFAILAGYHTGRGVTDVLAPLLSHEPLAALDVGLSPEVHAFVDALAKKDQITRDHVVRTSALAMRSAIRAGLSAQQVREVALGALLHDIGKLVVPSDIINKPGRLTDDEFKTIKSHPEQGECLLAEAPTLAAAARYVRGHHERVDGRGYPDGLSGDDISFEVGLVSVADAWDAMTNTRQYREGMGTDRAEQILREGAGTQWRFDAVECLLAEVHAGGDVALGDLTRFGARHDGTVEENDAVRSNLAESLPEHCPCSDALPSAIGGEFVTATTLPPHFPGTLPAVEPRRSNPPISPTSSPVLLAADDFVGSVRAALDASGSVGQLVSVRIAEASHLGGKDDAERALLLDATRKLVGAAIRSDDVVGVWESGHLVVSLPSASEASAKEIARRIRAAAAELATMATVFEGLRLDAVALSVRRSDVDHLSTLLDAPDPTVIDLAAG